MKPKPSIAGITGLVVLLLFLNACALGPSASPAVPATLVPTIAVVQPTAAVLQPSATAILASPTSIPAPQTQPTVPPTSVDNMYMPLEKAACAALQQSLSSQFGLAVDMQEAPFADSLVGTGGVSCNLEMTGTGLDLPGGFPTLLTALETFRNAGWYEDPTYAASGPMGESILYRQSAEKIAMVLLGVEFADNVQCPKDQPIDACAADPKDINYTLIVDVAQRKLPYQAEEQTICLSTQQGMNALLPAGWRIDEAAIEDFDLPSGSRGCRIQVSGSEEALQVDFPTIDRKVTGYFVETGWVADNTLAAAGPTGMIQGMRKLGQLALLYVQWEPSPDANCPKDQPISACELTPAQRLVTVTIYMAR